MNTTEVSVRFGSLIKALQSSKLVFGQLGLYHDLWGYIYKVSLFLEK